jgi:hypothetical protein
MMDVIGIDCPGGDIAGASELLEFIKGTGRFRLLGNGMHSYPGRDANNQKIHDACLSLETMKLIERTIDEPGHVIWEAKRVSVRIDGTSASAASLIAMMGGIDDAELRTIL